MHALPGSLRDLRHQAIQEIIYVRTNADLAVRVLVFEKGCAFLRPD